jgi:hypothetical protein
MKTVLLRTTFLFRQTGASMYKQSVLFPTFNHHRVLLLIMPILERLNQVTRVLHHPVMMNAIKVERKDHDKYLTMEKTILIGIRAIAIMN